MAVGSGVGVRVAVGSGVAVGVAVGSGVFVGMAAIRAETSASTVAAISGVGMGVTRVSDAEAVVGAGAGSSVAVGSAAQASANVRRANSAIAVSSRILALSEKENIAFPLPFYRFMILPLP